MMSERCEFAKVPNEVLIHIFSSVSTSDLLANCRLVSSRWNRVVAKVCRQRQVKFESGADYENLPICATIFKDPDNVPWSAIALSTTNSTLAVHSGQVAQIFGQTITSLEVKCSEGRLIGANLFQTYFDTAIFSRTSNLKKLDISLSDQILWAIVPALLKTSLQALSAHVKYTGESLTWTQLANQRQFTLENLSLISIGPIPSVDYFRPLERFLDSVGASLKTLKMVGFLNLARTDVEEAKLLKIPALPNLKQIELKMMKNGLEVGDGFGLHFEKLKAAQVPALENVHFQTGWEVGDGDDLVEVYKHLRVSEVFEALENGPFATVKTLFLGHHWSAYAAWARTFPNAIAIAITLLEAEEIEGFVAHFPKLEVLSLTMKILEGPINMALSHTIRFLPSLTALKKLIVVNGNTAGEPLSDAGAILFLLLRPLCLTITNAQLSDYCISLLRERHLRLDFQLS